jgi:hypothetical protein
VRDRISPDLPSQISPLLTASGTASAYYYSVELIAKKTALSEGVSRNRPVIRDTFMERVFERKVTE